MRTCCILVVVAMLSPVAAADLAGEADRFLAEAVNKHTIPAISAGVLVDGRIRWLGAAGMADIDSGTAATPDTVFRIASISKVMTAVAILQLAEKGLVELDAPVQKYLPDYPPPRKGTMTVEHLLAHTSGIRHSTDQESRTFEHYDSLRQACRLFEDRKLAFTPGTKYRYSSYGYTVLGAILEAVTGDTFEAYLRANVWKPAGMQHTDLDRRPSARKGDAVLYTREGGKVVPDVENDLSLIYPGGGMVSTAEDLLRLVIALDDGTLLSAPSIDQMLQHPTYKGKVLDEHGGLGWNVWHHETHGLILSRVGGQAGSSALLLSYRGPGVTVALLTNITRLEPIWELTNHLIGLGKRAKKGELRTGAAGD
jgi:CubicO group peptidase (beta-lactamase class C family)